MEIKGANIFVGHKFIYGDIAFDERIERITERRGESDLYVIPGLVDIHTHGAVGEDFSDGNEEGLRQLDNYYLSHGVTSYLATTMTVSEPELTSAVRAVKNAGCKGCKGIHLEGPFLSYAKRGAQSADNLRLPDMKLFERLDKESGEFVKLITIAPELEGAMDFILEASKKCAVSLGHTAADYETAKRAYEAGANHATHLFNAMPPLLHRQPGVVGAAMDCKASAELICDGLHIHPSVIRAAFAMFGDKIVLISDSLRCAGMPDGDYTLGGQPIVLSRNKATLRDGTLAGSIISLTDGMRNAVKFGIPLCNAVYAATTAPALSVGLDVGSLASGRIADIAVLNGELDLIDVYVAGKKFVSPSENNL